MYKYGRLKRTYKRSDYRLARFLPSDWENQLADFVSAGKSVRWQTDIRLDQGQTGHCGGFGFAGFRNLTPVSGAFQNDDAHNFYYGIVARAGFPESEDGVEVRWVMDYAKNELACIDGYAWAGSLDEARYWLAFNGPVMAGEWWTYGMETPNGSGFIYPTGGYAGGHFFVFDEWRSQNYDRGMDVFGLLNSWGKEWGIDGRALMYGSEYEPLHRDGGELVNTLELEAPSPEPEPQGCSNLVKRLLRVR